ncbi:MAG: HTH-type transcriptional repressor FabR [Gammaproteobacteria bacterium]|nr:HTH-type transcriptional repressor FabR [Gammaproteobacteria bacterium]
MKLSRKRQKEATRQKLLDAAGAELASGRSFDTLSLREVAKLAGIAPTSFYRHFHDMEELGLALIDEHGAGLLTLMHRVREQASEGRSLIRASVETLFDYIFSNQGVSRMILQESMARESAFHKAAEKLFVTLSKDLAEFLVWDAQQRGVPLSYPQLAANSAVAILFTTGIALLDAPAEYRDQRIEAAIIQLRMIMRGAEAMGKTT